MRQIGEKNQGRKPSKKSHSPTEVWLCLRFTHISLNALGHAYFVEAANQKAAQQDPIKPLAITDQNAIWQCNLAANKIGIEAGMSINHALILAPHLLFIERDIKTEANKLSELSYWAYRFSSLVSCESLVRSQKDQILLIEIGKSSKLFNGLDHLINLLNNDLGNFKIQTSIGLGLTPKAARVLSYGNQHTLNGYQKKLDCAELTMLDLDKKIIQKLLNCGFNSLGDLTNIPSAELGERFGKDTLLYLDQLWGRVADPQKGITPPETFHASADFAEPIHNFTWIQQQLERLLNDLTHFITSRQLICRSFTWRFFHQGNHQHANSHKNDRLLKTITIGVNAKQNIAKVFKELTDLKLASIKLDWEFTSIELSSKQFCPIQLYNDDLFDPKPSQEQFNQLIDKLSSRLGHAALFRVSSESEHLPELANGRRNAAQETREDATTYRPANKPVEKPFKDEPLWLLENPKRLPQFNNQVNLEGPLNLIHGPNRVSSHWWSKLQSRDYFIARQRSGRLLWIFYDRVQRQWFLQGLFA